MWIQARIGGTQEWFNLAIERELQLHDHSRRWPEKKCEASGRERRRPQLILKEWEEGDLLELVHPISGPKKSIQATTRSIA